MCGFAGFVADAGAFDDEALRAVVADMGAQLRRRGPDSSGIWSDAATGVALAHRRLSIIDLSDAGHQPMVSANGRYVIAYNGETYNFKELRRQLAADGVAVAGNCDTEVVLEACAQWGVEPAVKRMVGMFAFALWDRRDRRLHLVRDRLGIKPLYWGKVAQGGTRAVVFGSELKAFDPFPGWAPQVDRNALAAYFRFAYVPAPATIYRDIHKLEPGCIVTIGADRKPVVRRYWDLRAIAAVPPPASIDATAALDEMDGLIAQAVTDRLVADVPLGAFLSGGIDSAAVVALMSEHSARPVNTFTIGFDGATGYNEAEAAKAVAAHLGTHHTELYLTAQDALDVVPRLPDLFDEPFADSSQIPTFLVSEMTRRHVTVALSGDGGDEVFAGYNRYRWGDAVWRRVGPVPRGLRNLGAGALRGVSPAAWDRLAHLLPQGRRPRQLGDKLHKLAGAMASEDADGLYRALVSQWADPNGLVINGDEPRGLTEDRGLRDQVPEFVARMQLMDSLTYLPDDILTKVDRASMGVSLEARVPLLDHRVVEAAWRLPSGLKIKDGQSKWPLRRLVYARLPRQLMDRPKMGFAVPLDEWLRGPLRDWAANLLDPARLKAEGYIRHQPVARAWAAHQSGRRNCAPQLWTVLMFQAWLERFNGKI